MSKINWFRFWALGILWGTSFLWIKIAVSEVSPLVLVGFRTLFGALGLAAVLLAGKTIRQRWLEIRPWLKTFVFVGLVNVVIPFLCISWGEQHISSGLASVLNGAVPLFTVLLVPLMIPQDRLTPARLAGLVVGFGGVVVLFIPELIKSGLNQSMAGMGAMLAATCSYALGAVYIRRNVKTLDPTVQAFLQLATATLMVWGLTLTVEQPVQLPSAALTWAALLWLGLLGSCLAYMFYFALIHSIGPTRATMVTYVSPLIGVILGAVFLKEQITWQIILGGLMIFSGVSVVNGLSLPSLKKRPAASAIAAHCSQTKNEA